MKVDNFAPDMDVVNIEFSDYDSVSIERSKLGTVLITIYDHGERTQRTIILGEEGFVEQDNNP